MEFDGEQGIDVRGVMICDDGTAVWKDAHAREVESDVRPCAARGIQVTQAKVRHRVRFHAHRDVTHMPRDIDVRPIHGLVSRIQHEQIVSTVPMELPFLETRGHVREVVRPVRPRLPSVGRALMDQGRARGADTGEGTRGIQSTVLAGQARPIRCGRSPPFEVRVKVGIASIVEVIREIGPPRMGRGRHASPCGAC